MVECLGDIMVMGFEGDAALDRKRCEGQGIECCAALRGRFTVGEIMFGQTWPLIHRGQGEAKAIYA